MSTPDLAGTFPEAAALGAFLKERNLTVAVAESCTGGLLGAAITAIAGSSAWMRGGIIAYANDIKVEQLGVNEADLERYGAVSEVVARQMAEGVREHLHADIGLAITGIAGPANETTDKLVGLIFVAVATVDSVEVNQLNEPGDREANRAAAVRAALRLV